MFVIPCTEDEPLLTADNFYGLPYTPQSISLEGPHKKGCAPKILFVLEQPYSKDVFPRTVLLQRFVVWNSPNPNFVSGTALILIRTIGKSHTRAPPNNYILYTQY